jgi:hypothetical protein
MNKWISALLYRTLVKRSRTSTCMPILLVTERTWQLFFLYLGQTVIHCDDLLSSCALPCHYGKATCAHNLCIPTVCQNLLGLLFNFFWQIRSEAAVSFFLDLAGLPAFSFQQLCTLVPSNQSVRYRQFRMQ